MIDYTKYQHLSVSDYGDSIKVESIVGDMRLFKSVGNLNMCRALKNLNDLCTTVKTGKVTGPTVWRGGPACNKYAGTTSLYGLGGLADMFCEVEKENDEVIEVVAPSAAKEMLHRYGDPENEKIWRAKVVYDDTTPNEVTITSRDGVVIIGKWL